jgi:cell wall-associated NlpC family hydrolase
VSKDGEYIRLHEARLKTSANLFALIFSMVLATAGAAQPSAPLYAVAVSPTPVLNTPDFAGVFGGRDGKTIRLDGCVQIRETEFVALPGTVFRTEETINRGGPVIYRVTTDDYPYPSAKGYFIDSRFVRTSAALLPQRQRNIPPRQTVIDNLLAAQGSRYVWGGNVREGIPRLLSFYPPASGLRLSTATADLWQLRGVDCSGLLYEATGGFTPRNTSALVAYGAPVPIKGLDAEQIIRLVEPLDLIVWQGHVMIILDRERIIESRLDCHGNGGGVKVRSLREALIDIRESRVPLDNFPTAADRGVKGFVIRRWFPAGR